MTMTDQRTCLLDPIVAHLLDEINALFDWVGTASDLTLEDIEA